MVLSSFMRKIVCRQQKKESLCNRGIAQSYLQVLHVHVFLFAPLSACDIAQAGADEHQGGVAVGEGSHNPGPPPDLTVQAFNDVVRADPRPGVNPKFCVNSK